jgi:hypothetical protein
MTSADASRTLVLELPVDSEEDVAALEGALLAARASELAEARRRGDRVFFGYGSDTARDSMSAEVVQRRRRWTMLDRLLAALEASTRESR